MLAATSAAAQSDCIAVSFPNPFGAAQLANDQQGCWAESRCRTSLPDGTYASEAGFFLAEPQAVTICSASIEADPFLYLLDDQGDVIEFDDDGGPGLNSRIDRLLPAGSYRTIATTFTPGGDRPLLALHHPIWK